MSLKTKARSTKPKRLIVMLTIENHDHKMIDWARSEGSRVRTECEFENVSPIDGSDRIGSGGVSSNARWHRGRSGGVRRSSSSRGSIKIRDTEGRDIIYR